MMMTGTYELASALIAERRQRDAIFGEQMFGEPGWDMLLDLYVAQWHMRPVSTTSLCIASCVPPTTALRWIKRLTDQGWIERYEDKADRRRIYVRLSHVATGKMDQLLSSWLDGRKGAARERDKLTDV